MEQNTLNDFKDPYFDEVQAQTKFSFDFILWFYRILKYWYLFVISLALFLGFAYIKNKSWKPEYLTAATLMVEQRDNNISVAMGTVSYGSIRNMNNQQTILQSRKLAGDAISKLPQLQVDYFKKTQFKQDNLYGYTPVVIETNFIAPSAYNYTYLIEPINSERCKISYKETEESTPFEMELTYGKFEQKARFFIRVNKTDRFTPNFAPFNFRFIRKDDLISFYSGKVQTSPGTGSSTIFVSISSDNSKQSSEFLAELLNQFRENNLSLKNEASDNTIKFIDYQLSILNDSLRISEEVFRNFQDETGLYELESGSSREKLENVNKSLGELYAKEKSVLLLTDTIHNTVLNDAEIIDPKALGLDDSQSGVNLSSLVKEYNSLVSLMSDMGPLFPLYKKNEKKLINLKIEILEGLKSLLAQIQEQKEDLESSAIDIEQRMISLPSQEREFLRYQQRYQINERYTTYLIQKKYEANIQKASNVPDNYILEPPKQMGGPINTGVKTDRYLLFLVIGIILPLAFVVLKEEIFNFSIATKEDCERISHLPVIGTIENISKRKGTSGGTVLVKNLPKSSFAESFRNMRIRIEYIAQREYPLTVLVTSSEPADGKTFVASNVASIYQMTGKKVILVDFDLRRPSVAKTLGVDSKKGISNFLIGQVSLEEITLTHPEYGFDIITAGTLPPNPSELIRTDKTKDFVHYLQQTYDYVIMDCSPIGLVSDAYILSKLVDVTLFVVRRGKTNKSFFKSVVTQARNDGFEHLALVFNDVKGREGYYGTSRYYGDKSYYLKRNSYYHDDYFEK